LEPALGNLDALLVARPDAAIDQPMLGGDPARPPAGEFALQGFGLAQAGKRVAGRIVDERIDPAKDRRIIVQPITVVSPSPGRPEQLLRMRSCSSKIPASASAMALSSASRFAGVLMR
jgi:hypothetical protein